MSEPQAVTVVVPTHNRRTLLLRTLDSVLRQRGVAVSVIVVDDGGADGTVEAVRSLGAPNVELLRHEYSKGVSAARNAGLAVTDTAWVAFVDDDDLWAPDKLEAQIAAIRASNGAKWSCVRAVHINAEARIVRMPDTPRSGDISDLLLQAMVIPGGGSGVLSSTALAREVGGFDEHISIIADWDFYLRLSLQSPIAVVERPLLGYFTHSDSMYHHNPLGLSRELGYLERKYAKWPDRVQLDIDYRRCYFLLFRMALGMGDYPAARQLLVKGLDRVGIASFSRELAGRGLRKLCRMLLREPSHQDRGIAAWATPPPVGWEAEARSWLARYGSDRICRTAPGR